MKVNMDVDKVHEEDEWPSSSLTVRQSVDPPEGRESPSPPEEVVVPPAAAEDEAVDIEVDIETPSIETPSSSPRRKIEMKQSPKRKWEIPKRKQKQFDLIRKQELKSLSMKKHKLALEDELQRIIARNQQQVNADE